jgi:hypothetical protein
MRLELTCILQETLADLWAVNQQKALCQQEEVLQPVYWVPYLKPGNRHSLEKTTDCINIQEEEG